VNEELRYIGWTEKKRERERERSRGKTKEKLRSEGCKESERIERTGEKKEIGLGRE